MRKDSLVVGAVFVLLLVFAVVIASASSRRIKNATTEQSTEASVTESNTETEWSVEDVEIGTVFQNNATGLTAPSFEDISEYTTTQPDITTNTTTSTTTTTTTRLADPTTIVTTTVAYGYKMSDIDYLAAVIYQEAGADYVSDEARRYVAEVVLNRVADSNYPDDIYGVLTQKRQYGRYSSTGIPKLDKDIDGAERAYDTANDVLNGNTRVVPSNVVYQAEFPQGSGVWKYVDGIYFCFK